MIKLKDILKEVIGFQIPGVERPKFIGRATRNEFFKFFNTLDAKTAISSYADQIMASDADNDIKKEASAILNDLEEISIQIEDELYGRVIDDSDLAQTLFDYVNSEMDADDAAPFEQLLWYDDQIAKSIDSGMVDNAVAILGQLYEQLEFILGFIANSFPEKGQIGFNLREYLKNNPLLEKEYPKGKYVQVTDSSELKDIQDKLFDLIKNAYASIGGHVKFKSPSDIMDPSLTFWKVADIDADPEIDVTSFGKNTSHGIKHTGMGHDGDRSNIKNLLTYKSNMLKSPGNYVELSGPAFDSFVGKGGVPTVDDEETVRNILKGKELVWHGKHPSFPDKKGNGWYTRVIGGKHLTKTMAGIPS